MLIFLSIPVLTSAQTLFELIPKGCAGGAADPSLGASAENKCGLCELMQLVINVSSLILGLTGIATLLILLYAGAIFVTAYGREERIKWGKEVIIATITGVLIIFTAWIIINTLIIGLTGNRVTIQSLLNTNLGCAQSAPTPTIK
jgi:hypothetical protein